MPPQKPRAIDDQDVEGHGGHSHPRATDDDVEGHKRDDDVEGHKR